MARVARHTVRWLRRLPVTPVHPLRLYFLERGVALELGAKILGIAPRTIMNWVGWKTSPSKAWRAGVAGQLGKDADELFPLQPDRENES